MDDQLFDQGEDELVQCWRDPGQSCEPSCAAYDPRCEEDDRLLPCVLLNVERAKANAQRVIAKNVQKYVSWLEERSADSVDSELKREEASKLAEAIRGMDKPPPEVKT